MVSLGASEGVGSPGVRGAGTVELFKVDSWN